MEEKIFNTPSGKVVATISKEGDYSKRFSIHEMNNPKNRASIDSHWIAVLYIGNGKVTATHNSASGWNLNYQERCFEDSK